MCTQCRERVINAVNFTAIYQNIQIRADIYQGTDGMISLR